MGNKENFLPFVAKPLYLKITLHGTQIGYEDPETLGLVDSTSVCKQQAKRTNLTILLGSNWDRHSCRSFSSAGSCS